jgi:bifunctional aspartokinase / homoserine dehydrogenase 1
MSDKVIRLGGSQIGNAPSVNNLVTYLNRHNGRNFIVCSAIPGILNLIRNAVDNVFTVDLASVTAQLHAIFTDNSGRKVSAGYAELADHLVGILKGIALIGDYSASLKDQVLSFSEKLTVEIFKIQLEKFGADVEILWPERFELTVTPDFGNATFVSLSNDVFDRITGKIVLVPGSYGITSSGKIARAGKTAADYTAAFLTRKLNVPKLELWGLEFAFLRADPAIVANSPRIERLTYSEASELAYFDHFSFHPRTVEPLESNHIPIYVLSTESGDGIADTLINTETYIEKQIVKSVACTDDISLLRLSGPGVGLKPGILAKVTSQLNLAGINIKSVITSQISINLILERKTGNKALELIRQLGFTSVQEVVLIDDVSLVGIVGHGMQKSYGVSAKIFNAVANHKINVELSGSGASDLVSYLVVKTSDKQKSVKAIYDAFFNSFQTKNF